MTVKTDNAASQNQPKPDLVGNYRPLALRAVLAAHVVLKGQSTKKQVA